MVLANLINDIPVVYVDAEAFDITLRPTSKFLLVQLLHMNCDVSVYQSTGQCLIPLYHLHTMGIATGYGLDSLGIDSQCGR
jgi:hypothetical protein